ncbi:MAG: calcium/sodium antiporter [marine benthic group bacterium]|nr:calcium/sodium antiporter [Gemmatimonadota bacterium]MCL7962505.1 calcium/sodium antiporter [Candidatus Carthagonibacter metallireducens]MCL7981976.1 calcium/sodium antiporter [Gemmatimonadota bacterium]MCL7991121.1 calcium/sodium antiporter [Gemmatimonadota bacterium]
MPGALITVYNLVAGGVLLWFGAETFVRSSSALAIRMGLTPLVVGLTVVAFGTSAPELGVSLISTFRSMGDVATGNVVGSNIANVGLILGLSALIRPIRIEPKLLQLDVPIVVAVSLLATLLFEDGVLSRPEAGFLVFLLIGYILLSLRKSRLELDVEVSPVGESTGRRPLAMVLGLILAGLAMLVMGSFAFVNGAQELAVGLGVKPAIVGLTVVAVGTSLPEAATSVVAAWRGQGEIAVGNLVGSNLFNLLAILGVTGLVRPVMRGQVSMVSFAVMIGLAVALVPLMRSGFEVSRREGAALLFAYAAYVYWLIP